MAPSGRALLARLESMKLRSWIILFVLAQALGAVGFLFGGAHGNALISGLTLLLLPGLLVALGVHAVARFESIAALALTILLTNALTWIVVFRLRKGVPKG